MNEEFKEHKIDIEEHFVSRIQDIVIDTFLSVRKSLNPNNRKDCWELFGFDFLIDEDFRVWLIEVNTNPYLGSPNKYIADLMPQMLDDMVKLTVDPTYEPKNVDSRPNNFDILYREDQACTTRGKLPVNKRRPFALDLCYPIPELKPKPQGPYIKKYPNSLL